MEPPRQAVEFGVSIGEYKGVVRVPRDVFRRFIDGAVTPERCIEAYHLQRTRFELVTERKLRRSQLTDEGNVEITGRDLRERATAVWQCAHACRCTIRGRNEVNPIGFPRGDPR